MLMTDVMLRLEPDQAHARIVRDQLRSWAEIERLSEDGCDNAIFVASELFSNAVTAADPGTLIDVRVTHIGDTVKVAVENNGPEFDPTLLVMPQPTDERGRGIAIARLLGVLSVSRVGRMTCVTVMLAD